jgi:hypothetical protein
LRVRWWKDIAEIRWQENDAGEHERGPTQQPAGAACTPPRCVRHPHHHGLSFQTWSGT